METFKHNYSHNYSEAPGGKRPARLPRQDTQILPCVSILLTLLSSLLEGEHLEQPNEAHFTAILHFIFK